MSTTLERPMHQRSRSRLRRLLLTAGTVTILTVGMPATASVGRADQAPMIGAPDAVFYRIFLRDGGMLVSYGEFAQVADRVVASIPIGGTESSPVLHVVSIAEGEVDWERTNAYVQAARARRYAETRGEADFARLTREVADMLNQVGMLTDDSKRLALAESARRRLVEWPRQHHGYRTEEISQMAIWLDQVVSELRIAAGQSSFDLALVAGVPAAAPAVPLLPPPDLRERVEFGLIAASRATDAAGRVSILRAVLDALQPAIPEGSWMAAAHARASAELAIELRTDRAYALLTRRTLQRAAGYVKSADVRGLESLVGAVLKEDSTLNRARPAEMAALLATLDARIDAARRLRLARDTWAVRSAAIRVYWRDVRQGLDRLLGLREWLIDVRQLAGPAPRSVRRLAAHAAIAEAELGRLQPPAEVASAHAALAAASTLAKRAAAGRLDAIQSGNIDTAWQASSAAAGSLMLLDQAVEELRRITRAPVPAPR